MPGVAERPNILWIVFEDISPNLGAYGDEYARTPNLDRFAAQSVRYTRAFSNGGACAPARSTLITGMYPPAIGTHHMRSEGVPPAYVIGFPQLLREAGYYTSNHSKTDYNWIAPADTWDTVSADWRGQGWARRGGKPFFTVVNITDTHSSQIYHPWSGWPQRHESLPDELRHSPEGARVPPYYPETPEVRQAYARYADNISFADRITGEVLAQLQRDGLADSTIVFFYSDHGAGMPRSKSFLFESSLLVPLLIRFPDRFSEYAPARPGMALERTVAFVDFAPTVLSLAGVEAPAHFHGKAFLGPKEGTPREFAFGYRDRMDERYEFIRSVRRGRWKYIRNYFPHLPWFFEQTRLYPSTHPVALALHGAARAGRLTDETAVYMGLRKPREQLFDLERDPHEIRNLAADPGHQETLGMMREGLRQWTVRHRDLGFLPESEMWLRYGGAAPEAFERNPELYPVERILETADWVGLGTKVADRQVERMADPNSTVRFWAATGLLASGARGGASRAALRDALADSSEAVATIAAQALCQLGECSAALNRLLGQLQHEDERVVLRAANAIHQLWETGGQARAHISKLHEPVSGLQGRDFFREAAYPQWVYRSILQPAF